MGSTPVGGGLASQIHNTMMFSRLGFPPPSNQAKGWRLCRAGRKRSARPLSTDVVRP